MEAPGSPRNVIEAALAHVAQNKVEVSYRCTNSYKRRRRLMEGWKADLGGKKRYPEVVTTAVAVNSGGTVH